MKKGVSINSHILILLAFLVITLASYFEIVEAQTCVPSGEIYGTTPPPGKCNQENQSDCCEQGSVYPTYTCSPPVGQAVLSINSFEQGGDGGGPAACDNKYHSDDSMVVALSTGWFNGGQRCMSNIAITANGQTVYAMVVDECDSTTGCDGEHDYQPPCSDNTVDASKAVWKALGISENNWGELDIVWYDA